MRILQKAGRASAYEEPGPVINPDVKLGCAITFQKETDIYT